MTERLPADYDDWRLGLTGFRQWRVIARCRAGHTWRAVATTERNSTSLEPDECPEPGCELTAESYETEERDEECD